MKRLREQVIKITLIARQMLLPRERDSLAQSVITGFEDVTWSPEDALDAKRYVGSGGDRPISRSRSSGRELLIGDDTADA